MVEMLGPSCPEKTLLAHCATFQRCVASAESLPNEISDPIWQPIQAEYEQRVADRHEQMQSVVNVISTAYERGGGGQGLFEMPSQFFSTGLHQSRVREMLFGCSMQTAQAPIHVVRYWCYVHV